APFPEWGKGDTGRVGRIGSEQNGFRSDSAAFCRIVHGPSPDEQNECGKKALPASRSFEMIYVPEMCSCAVRSEAARMEATILNVCGAIFAGLYFGGLLLAIRNVRRERCERD